MLSSVPSVPPPLSTSLSLPSLSSSYVRTFSDSQFCFQPVVPIVFNRKLLQKLETLIILKSFLSLKNGLNCYLPECFTRLTKSSDGLSQEILTFS